MFCAKQGEKEKRRKERRRMGKGRKEKGEKEKGDSRCVGRGVGCEGWAIIVGLNF